MISCSDASALRRPGLYLRANEQAIADYRTMSRGVDCGFETKDNYVYSCSGRAKLEAELRALDKLGHPAVFAEALPLPFAVDGAVCFPGAGAVPGRWIFSPQSPAGCGSVSRLRYASWRG